jgi:hypothetical protein
MMTAGRLHTVRGVGGGGNPGSLSRRSNCLRIEVPLGLTPDVRAEQSSFVVTGHRF